MPAAASHHRRPLLLSFKILVFLRGEGYKEVLGLWISQMEGAKFWPQIVTELKNRGVQDI